MSILGVVMAGGRNTRFGDIKALATVGGARIIDRVIVLSAGKVIADGPVDRVVKMDQPWIREYFSARAPAQERA